MAKPIKDVNVTVVSINEDTVQLSIGYEGRTIPFSELRARAETNGQDAWEPVLANIGMRLGLSAVDWDNLANVKAVIEGSTYKMHMGADLPVAAATEVTK